MSRLWLCRVPLYCVCITFPYFIAYFHATVFLSTTTVKIIQILAIKVTLMALELVTNICLITVLCHNFSWCVLNVIAHLFALDTFLHHQPQLVEVLPRAFLCVLFSFSFSVSRIPDKKYMK